MSKKPPKSYWNARVIVTTNPKYPEDKIFAVHEVYYKKGKVIGMTVEPVRLISDVSAKDLKVYLKILKKAFKKPYLSGDEKTLYQETCSGKKEKKKILK